MKILGVCVRVHAGAAARWKRAWPRAQAHTSGVRFVCCRRHRGLLTLRPPLPLHTHTDYLVVRSGLDFRHRPHSCSSSTHAELTPAPVSSTALASVREPSRPRPLTEPPKRLPRPASCSALDEPANPPSPSHPLCADQLHGSTSVRPWSLPWGTTARVCRGASRVHHLETTCSRAVVESNL